MSMFCFSSFIIITAAVVAIVVAAVVVGGVRLLTACMSYPLVLPLNLQ